MTKTCATCNHWNKQGKFPGFGHCLLPTMVFEYEESAYPQDPLEVVLRIDEDCGEGCLVNMHIVTGEGFSFAGWRVRG